MSGGYILHRERDLAHIVHPNGGVLATFHDPDGPISAGAMNQVLAALNGSPVLPAARAEDWRDILADVIWWFQGFSAAERGRESYERSDLPDLSRLRDMRMNLSRLAEGKEVLP